MLKIVATIRRKPGLTHEQFKNYYENNHRKLVKHFSDWIVDYRRTYPRHDLSAVGDIYDPSSGASANESQEFDCLTEIWVQDEAALAKMYEIMAVPEIAAIFAEDESRFIDRDSVRIRVCEEYTICEVLGRYENSPALAAL